MSRIAESATMAAYLARNVPFLQALGGNLPPRKQFANDLKSMTLVK